MDRASEESVLDATCARDSPSAQLLLDPTKGTRVH